MSGRNALRFSKAVSLTKRAHRLGCEAGTADFLEPSAAESGGNQCSNRPCVLRVCAHSHSPFSSLSLISSVSPCSTLHTHKHKHATHSAGPVRKALVHSEVARQHTAHEMLRVQQWLGLIIDVEIPRQMEKPAALGSHFRAQEAHPLIRVPILPSCAAGSNFCLPKARVDS